MNTILKLANSPIRSILADSKWALILFGVNVFLQSIYAIEVCPYIEGLSYIEIISANLIISVIIFFMRFIIYHSLFKKVNYFSSRNLVLFDTVFILSIGIVWGIYNKAINDFPVTSALKVMTGFLSIGILTGIALFVIRKVNLISEEEIQFKSIELDEKQYNSISNDLLLLAIISIIIISINGIFIILKDLEWITTLGSSGHKIAIKSIMTEVIFVALTYGFYIILISVFYSKYLKLQLKNQTDILIKVSNGNLSEKAKLLGNDEFSILSSYTNKMIFQLIGHSEISKSIEYAKRIQNVFLPNTITFKEKLKKSFILYKPKDTVAGDFYWLESKNNKTLFGVADCTGHGVPGAMVSITCSGGLNRSVREYNLTDPSKILDKTREIVIQHFEKSDEDIKDGMDIALCSLEGKTLTYAGAYNPLWIIRKGATEIEEIKGDRQPIGKFYNSKPYTSHMIELNSGDNIYIFSDGYVDQFGGEKGKKFKVKSFRKLLLSMQDRTMEEQEILLNNTFEEWKGNLEQVDDVCLMGIKIA